VTSDLILPVRDWMQLQCQLVLALEAEKTSSARNLAQEESNHWSQG
jgi:hypothetical protein